MSNDKTIAMPLELAERICIELGRHPGPGPANRCYELRELIAAPGVERQDGSALMKIAADLANRHPLRQLYLVCEHQGRINTDSLHEHLDKCGDLLAGIALDIRRAITSPPAPVAVILPDRRNDDCDRSSPNSWTDWGIGWNACLDMMKEMNQ